MYGLWRLAYQLIALATVHEPVEDVEDVQPDLASRLHVLRRPHTEVKEGLAEESRSSESGLRHALRVADVYLRL